MAPTFTTSYSTLKRFLKPRSFGMRMWSGVWPPSNQGGIEPPARAFWPLVPRPAVLPLPAAMPRPTRVFALCAPSAGRRSCSFMPSPGRPDAARLFVGACARSLTHVSALARVLGAASTRSRLSADFLVTAIQLLDGHEEPDLADHAAGRGVVGDGARAADALQAERTERGTIAGDVADPALDLGDLELSGHRPPPCPAPADRRSGWSAAPHGGRSAPRRSATPGARGSWPWSR